jgi:hypothetical protein
MNRKTAFPFLTLPDSAVHCGPILLGTKGEPLMPTAEILDAWDYARDLEVSVNIGVDLEKASDALRIPMADLRLRAVLKAGTGVGMMPRRWFTLCSADIYANETQIDLRADISSRDLSARLLVQVSLLLGSVPRPASALSPRSQGARLWTTSKDILIEDGGAARFPVEAVSFSQFFHGLNHANAPWFIDWPTGNWDQDFSGVVRLYINSDLPDVLERFAGGDALLLQSILSDTMIQMTSSLLSSDLSEGDMEEFPEGSVGAQVRRWITLAMPGSSLETVRSIHAHFPGRFSAAMLSAADTGADE